MFKLRLLHYQDRIINARKCISVKKRENVFTSVDKLKEKLLMLPIEH